ncbi:MAG: hypothetical protein ACXWJN_04735 [Methyloceanibacter sp.]
MRQGFANRARGHPACADRATCRCLDRRRRASQGADDLDRLNHEIERLYGEGKSAAALPLAERYVDLTRER